METIISQLPSPIDILLDPLSLIILGIYALLIAAEEIFPARKLPRVKYWRIRGLASFTLFFFVASYLPMFTDSYLAKYQLMDLSSWGILPSALLGFVMYETVVYAYHRTVHRSNFLWRNFHQVHHSAERLDSYGALFHSPLDMVGFTFVTSFCFAFIMGLPPEAITLIVLVINFLAFFQHANIHTPHWMGYIVQRPESHSIHHAKGIHHYNYSDLPLVDMIFGTFKNPHNYQKETGFYLGASSRIPEMLRGKDVSKQKPF